MTIRKNFLLDDVVAKHLEDIAKRENTTQTKVIKNMIEEKYEQYSVEEKLEALERISGSYNGMFVGKSIQSIKREIGKNS